VAPAAHRWSAGGPAGAEAVRAAPTAGDGTPRRPVALPGNGGPGVAERQGAGAAGADRRRLHAAVPLRARDRQTVEPGGAGLGGGEPEALRKRVGALLPRRPAGEGRHGSDGGGPAPPPPGPLRRSRQQPLEPARAAAPAPD